MNARSVDSRTGCPPSLALAEAVVTASGRFEQHVRICPRCRKQWDRLSAIVGLFPESAVEGDARTSCPDAVEWVALLEREVAGARRESLLDHLCECGSCASLWSFLVETAERDGQQIPAPEDGRPPDTSVRDGEAPFYSSVLRGSALRYWTAALAAAVLAIVVLRPLPPIGSGAAERWRGPAPALRSEVAFSRDGQQASLRWQQWPGADGYRLRVWHADEGVVLERHLDSTVHEWSLDRERVDELSTFWIVEALRDGAVVAAGRIVRLDWPRPRGSPTSKEQTDEGSA